MAGGFPIPGSFSPTGLLQTISGMFGTLDPSQLGNLLALVTLAVNGDPSTYDLTKLTTLLDALVPGVSSLLTPTQLTSMLTGLQGGSVGASTPRNAVPRERRSSDMSAPASGFLR